jgi:hypothetical protein
VFRVRVRVGAYNYGRPVKMCHQHQVSDLGYSEACN